MSESYRKSRTFAVVLTYGETLGVYFLWKQTGTRSAQKSLEFNTCETPWPVGDKDTLIDLFVKAGLTVRFYDEEEKQWMDHSKIYGLIRAPGSRDGQWGFPTTIEQFEAEFLATV